MKFPFFKFKISLRHRFALGLGAVLLPFLMAAGVGQFYLLPRLIDPLNNIVRELSEEVEPASHLQIALLQAAMPVNDYLIHGNPDERRQFIHLRQRVEQAFQEASPERYTLEQERAMIETARAQWLQALPLGEQLLKLPNPVGNAAAARDMEQFDTYIDRAVLALDKMRDHFRQVIDDNHRLSEGSRTRAIWVTIAAFVVAFGLSLFTSLLLSHSVLKAVSELGRTTTMLSEGNLSARALLDSDDEFGQFAHAFNAMAEKLEISQAALTELAEHDGLTSLLNHRTFYKLLTQEVDRCHRYGRTVSVLMLDLDHFKRVNDQHGHRAGDTVLRKLGQHLSMQLRTIDLVCRYGGEEIAIILLETDQDTAVQVAERIRAAFATTPFIVNDKTRITVQVSIGVATYPNDADTADQLVAAADSALYYAKEHGRNRVAIATDI